MACQCNFLLSPAFTAFLQVQTQTGDCHLDFLWQNTLPVFLRYIWCCFCVSFLSSFSFLQPPTVSPNCLFFNYLFWLCWIFVAVLGLSLVAASGGHSLVVVLRLMRWLLLLRSVGSRCLGFSSCGSRALEQWLRSYGVWAWLLWGIGIFLDQGLNPCPLNWRILIHCTPKEVPSCFLKSELLGAQSEVSIKRGVWFCS